MARQRMCHKPGQHAPPTTEPHAPGEKGTETTRSAAAPVHADPTTTHHTEAAAGILKLTICSCMARRRMCHNPVSMHHRRPKHMHRGMKPPQQQGSKVSGRPGVCRPHHNASYHSCCRHIKTHILSMARRRMCHEPGQHAPSTTETHVSGNEGTETPSVTRSVAALAH